MIKLKNFEIIDIDVEKYFEMGDCDTCDYGSMYVDEMLFTLKEGGCIFFKLSHEEKPCGFSYGELMRFILVNLDEFKNKTVDEFIDMLKKDILEITGEDTEIYVD